MPSFSDRLQHAWNAFMNRDPTPQYFQNGEVSYSSSYNPSHIRLSRGNERTIVTSIYNRIAVDAAQIKFRHVKLDNNGYFIKEMDSSLNYCLTISANKDQTGRAFIQDVVMSMFDEGYIAIVPVDTTINPERGAFDIDSMRTGKIVEWRPDHVKINVYNDRTGNRQDVWFAKKNVAIIENPLYSIMNEPNSTLQRLIRKLVLLDSVDEQTNSNKLNMIIQLPYSVNTQLKKQQAEQRRKDIEMQLTTSKYGIAYSDATEKITQLNRPLENNLLEQIKNLTDTLYGQLGITDAILNGSADEQTMMNYYSRTVEPIVSAIADEMRRKFLSKTAVTQHQSIAFFRDPFKLVPTSKLAELADKFTRNEIMSSNEFRQVVGLLPVDDPRANELSNKNINRANGETFANTMGEQPADQEGVPIESLSPEEMSQLQPVEEEAPVAENQEPIEEEEERGLGDILLSEI